MENKINESAKKALDCFKKQDYEGAINSFEKALIETPDDPHVINNMGLCYSKLGQDDKAEEMFVKALSLNSKQVESYINLTDVYFRNRKIEDAVNLLENAVTFMPDNIVLKHTLARVYIEDKRYDMAMDQLSEILDESPKNSDAYWDLGNIYFELGDYDSATACFEQLLELVDSNHIIYYQTGLTYEANDNIDKAISNHLKAIAHNPEFHPSYKKLGILFMARGENEDAIEYFGDYLKFDLPEEEKETIKNIISRITT